LFAVVVLVADDDDVATWHNCAHLQFDERHFLGPQCVVVVVVVLFCVVVVVLDVVTALVVDAAYILYLLLLLLLFSSRHFHVNY